MSIEETTLYVTVPRVHYLEDVRVGVRAQERLGQGSLQALNQYQPVKSSKCIFKS